VVVGGVHPAADQPGQPPGGGSGTATLVDAAIAVLARHPAWGAVAGPVQRDRLVAHVSTLLAAGWTAPDLLARWQFQPRQATNPGGLLVTRVLSTDSPDLANPGLEQAALPAWCGRCGTDSGDDRARTNPRFRLVHDPQTNSDNPCPLCHPGRPCSRGRGPDLMTRHERDDHTNPASAGQHPARPWGRGGHRNGAD
jgi:hypothetical protein